MKILYITDLTSIPCEIASAHELIIVFGEGYHEYDEKGQLIIDNRSPILIQSKFKRMGIEPPQIIRVKDLEEISVDVVLKELTRESTLWRYGDFSKVKSKFGVYRVVHDEYTKNMLIKAFGESYTKKMVMINDVVDFVNNLSNSLTE